MTSTTERKDIYSRMPAQIIGHLEIESRTVRENLARELGGRVLV